MHPEFLTYIEIRPHPSLKGIVEHYRFKSMKLPGPLVFPNHSPVFQGLIFNFQDLDDLILHKGESKNLKHNVYFVGQAISPSYLHSISSSLELIAVNFTLMGVYRLTGMNLHEFTDQIVDAQIVFGNEINELYEKIILLKDPMLAIDLIERFLYSRVQKTKKQNKVCVQNSLTILHENAGGISIKELQQLTNTSPKTLERVFKTEIGMTPKMLQRLLRFNQAKKYLEENRSTDWWKMVIQFGYYDQSHFISEFQTFAGLTPKQYLKELRGVMV